MKTINVSFEDAEIEAIEKAKKGQSWRKFILERATIDSNKLSKQLLNRILNYLNNEEIGRGDEIAGKLKREIEKEKKQMNNYRINRIQEIEKQQKQFENDLKAAGYYDGKPVMIIAGNNGLRVKSPEPEIDPIKIEGLRLVPG